MMMGGCLCPMLFCKSGLYTKAACVSSGGMGGLGEREVSLVPEQRPGLFCSPHCTLSETKLSPDCPRAVGKAQTQCG